MCHQPDMNKFSGNFWKLVSNQEYFPPRTWIPGHKGSWEMLVRKEPSLGPNTKHSNYNFWILWRSSEKFNKLIYLDWFDPKGLKMSWSYLYMSTSKNVGPFFGHLPKFTGYFFFFMLVSRCLYGTQSLIENLKIVSVEMSASACQKLENRIHRAPSGFSLLLALELRQSCAS